MASLVLLKNPLAPHTREIYQMPTGSRPIDWLQEHYPQGFGMPVRFFIRDAEHDLDDLDYAMQEDDVVVLAVSPGIGGGVLEVALIGLALAAVVGVGTYFLASLFAPDTNRKGKGEAASVFNVSSNQNSARVGSPIPVQYGQILITPDYASQPYTWYDTNMDLGSGTESVADRALAHGNQYLDILLCLGQGEVDVDAVFVGETRFDATTPEVQWQLYKVADHQKRMGTITPTFTGSRPFSENVITSTEVSNQEFTQANESVGFFSTCKRGQKGRFVQCDFVFPSGLFWSQSDGDVVGFATTIQLHFQELDADDNLIGPVTTVDYVVSTNDDGKWSPGAKYGPQRGSRNGVLDPRLETNYAGNDAGLNSAFRISFTEQMSHSGRWACKVVRPYEQQSGNRGQSKFIWSSLKLFADYVDGEIYGDTTLLVCRIKASNAIGSDASVRISTLVTRKIPALGSGANGDNPNPADVFVDIYHNRIYGADRPLTELDMTKITALKTAWAGNDFNYEYRSKQTIWNALATSVVGMVAEPLPIGGLMSIAQDGTKPTRSMMFTDANIVKDSFSLAWSFNTQDAFDGVEIEYLDPVTYKEAFVRWPASSVNPDEQNLPGCTSEEYALRYAKTLWQRRIRQRKRIEFTTELEGIALQLGDRIGVSHSVPKWGDSGLVLRQTGNVLTVDHDLDWSVANPVVMLRDADGSPTAALPVTRGAADNEIDLGSAPPIVIHAGDTQEFTSFAFGDQSTFIRDYTVATTRPGSDGTVQVEAVNYDERVFENGPTHLGGAQTVTFKLSLPSTREQPVIIPKLTGGPVPVPATLTANVIVPPKLVPDISAEISLGGTLPADKAYTITVVSMVHGEPEVTSTIAVAKGDAEAAIARAIAGGITDTAVHAHAAAGVVTVDPAHSKWIEKLEVRVG